MITLPQVIASNEHIGSTFPDGLVAVFVGGTSGVGEYTLKTLAKYAPKLRAYIVGRSQDAADRIIAECKKINPGGKFEFIKADVSLLKNVDEVCRQIRDKETSINILFLTQGTMAFKKSTSLSYISLFRKHYQYYNTLLIAYRNLRRATSRLCSNYILTHTLHLKPPPSSPRSGLSPSRCQRWRRNLRGRYRCRQHSWRRITSDEVA